MFPIYTVKPITPGEGFELTGPDLPTPVRYDTEQQAASMAHHLGRETGGRVVHLSARGEVIITEVITTGPESTVAAPTEDPDS
jgi:hypothetical protein